MRRFYLRNLCNPFPRGNGRSIDTWNQLNCGYKLQLAKNGGKSKTPPFVTRKARYWLPKANLLRIQPLARSIAPNNWNQQRLSAEARTRSMSPTKQEEQDERVFLRPEVVSLTPSYTCSRLFERRSFRVSKIKWEPSSKASHTLKLTPPS